MRAGHAILRSGLLALLAALLSAPVLAWQAPQAQVPNAPEGALVKVQGTSLLGDPLLPAEPSEETLENLRQAIKVQAADPQDADALIWLGRRHAYAGQYRQAIRVFTRGIDQYPDDPRFYRRYALLWRPPAPSS